MSLPHCTKPCLFSPGPAPGWVPEGPGGRVAPPPLSLIVFKPAGAGISRHGVQSHALRLRTVRWAGPAIRLELSAGPTIPAQAASGRTSPAGMHRQPGIILRAVSGKPRLGRQFLEHVYHHKRFMLTTKGTKP
eukprot:3385837-Rhodomonas_salina.1